MTIAAKMFTFGRRYTGAAGGGAGQYYLTFNGTTSYVICGDNASLQTLHGADFTAEAWTWRSAVGDSNPVIFGKGQLTFASGWGCYATTTSANLRTTMQFATTDISYAPLNTAPIDSAWHHQAMVYDSSAQTLELFLDGSSIGTSSAGSGAAVSDAGYPFVIGALSNNLANNNWLGYMAWVRLSDNKRYTAGFTPDAKDSPPAVDGNTVEQWNLNDGSGVTATAEVNASNNGAITDGVWGSL